MFSRNFYLSIISWQSHSVSLYPEEVEIVRDKEVIAPLLLDIKSEDAIQKEKVSKQSRAKHRNRGRAKTTNTEISHFDEDISVNIFKDTLLLFNLSNDIWYDLCFLYYQMLNDIVASSTI